MNDGEETSAMFFSLRFVLSLNLVGKKADNTWTAVNCIFFAMLKHNYR